MLVLAATARTCLAWPAQPSEVLESGSHFMFNCGSNAGSATYLLYNLKPSYLSSPGLNFSNLQNVNDMIKLSWGFSEKTMQIKKIGWPLTKVYAALRGLASSGCSSDVPSFPGSSSLAPLAQRLLWFFFFSSANHKQTQSGWFVRFIVYVTFAPTRMRTGPCVSHLMLFPRCLEQLLAPSRCSMNVRSLCGWTL